MKRLTVVLILVLMLVGCTTQRPSNQLFGTYGSDEGFKIVFTGSKVIVVQNDVVKHEFKYSVEDGKYIIDTAGEASIFIDNVSDDLKSFSTPIEAINSKMREFTFLNNNIQP